MAQQQQEMDSLKQAQFDMRTNHLSGATGIVVSGLMWLLAAIVAYKYSSKQALWTLLIGGVLIHPVSVLLNKTLGVSGTHAKNNPMSSLTMEGTFFMLMCIPLAYGLSFQRIEWFFQGMLLIIGGRYLTFNTLYGNRLFWVLGAVLGSAGYVLFSLNAQPYASALTGSLIEISCGLFMYVRAREITATR